MIFQPAALALLLAASLNALFLTGTGLFAWQLLRRWDPASATERQIGLERRTWLVSTLVGLVLVASLPALALFVHNADAMAPFFTGAMCAVGSLQVNAWGMPALLAQLGLFFLAAAWLVLNHLDRLGWDTPLIRAKYRLLLGLAPLAIVHAALLWFYYLNLNPEVITSCCGSLFGPDSGGAAAELAALPADWARPLYFAGWLATLAGGVLFLATGRLGRAFGVMSGLHFGAALVAVLSFVAPYVYEQPNHHCPFCLLQAEHGHAGWLLYPPLFLGTAAGIGAGLAAAARGHPSLTIAAPRLARHLTWVALAGLGGFGLMVLTYMLRSNLIL